MKFQSNKDQYEHIFLRFSKQVEKWLVKSLVIFIILLIIAQALLQSTDIRKSISRVERLEGVPYDPSIEVYPETSK